MAANIRHSADHADWYTPADIVERARAVMGSIWLDPFSHPEANKTVKAEVFFTAKDDGLKQSWHHPKGGRGFPAVDESVFINPPGKLTTEAWDKLMEEWPYQWLWVGFSLEQLQTLQSAESTAHPLDFNHCIPSRRIAYVENKVMKRERIARKAAKALKEGKPVDVQAWGKSSPSHGSYIVYHGPNSPAFAQEFAPLGKVVLIS